jgi:hypothetical protein
VREHLLDSVGETIVRFGGRVEVVLDANVFLARRRS